VTNKVGTELETREELLSQLYVFLPIRLFLCSRKHTYYLLYVLH